MAEQPFAPDFRLTGGRNGVSTSKSIGKGMMCQDKIAVHEKLIINSIKSICCAGNQMR